MKNLLKLLGIIALVAVIGFSMAACDSSDDSDDNSGSSSGSGGSSGGTGGAGKNPSITIKNDTGYTISGIYIKPSTSTDWGSDLLGYSSMSDGTSRTFELSQSLTSQSVYDIQLYTSSGSGYNFTKYMVTVSNGMTITFTNTASDDGSNLPTITIQNRSGKSFDSVHIKPSASSDWGKSLIGYISNNSDQSVAIPIPPSSYKVFDIQTRSSNPTNTYTRSNVTVSDGMVLTFTSADADNPNIELPVIVIQNDTGYTITSVYIKPSTSTGWGSDLEYSPLSDGKSRAFQLSQHLSVQSVYDIRLYTSSGSGYNFVKHSVTVSEGMIVTFTTSDLQP